MVFDYAYQYSISEPTKYLKIPVLRFPFPSDAFSFDPISYEKYN